jgi:RimJ/RimL family protein N-acetyltransferase
MRPCPAQIVTERLILRRWREEDRTPYARLNENPHVMRFFPKTRTREESDAEADWLDERFTADGFGPWAVEIPGVAPFIGFVGAWRIVRDLPFTPAVEIGCAVEAARASLHDVFERTDLDEIVAYTAGPNAPSRRVMEKLGMSHDAEGDFNHPAVPENHPLQRHVLYRLSRGAFAASDRV